MRNTFFKSVLALGAVLALASCDKDFNEIGSEIVGDDHFGMETKFDVSVEARTVSVGPVESRNLPINPLGVYKNAVFGTTVASFVTQVEMKSPNPTFDPTLNPEVVSVVLDIPYYSRHVDTEQSGTRIFELDSVYGTGKFNLQVYRSGYYMRDISYEGDEQEAQLFYTDEGAVFNSMKVGDPLNNATSNVQNTDFFFNSAEQQITEIDSEGNEEVTKLPPGMRLDLDNEAFQQAIIEAPAGMLANNNVFKNYFRGIYFKAEDSGNVGAMALLNFKQGTISITYEEDRTVDGVITRAERTVVLNLAGNTASLQENNYSANYLNALAQTTGANSRLWIKGGQGSVATIDLFGSEDLDGNNVPDQLDQIRDENWLINEANLTFYIDRVKMDTTVGQTSRAVEPQRIYLYDLTNRRPIVDYSADGTTAADPKKKKMIYGGLIERENVENGKGIRYKIRLTNYVNQLVKNADSTNIRLGLSVTEDINTFSMVRLRNDNPELKNVVPTASVMSPLGTVLYGTTAAQEDKRLKLEIYYTKPE